MAARLKLPAYCLRLTACRVGRGTCPPQLYAEAGSPTRQNVFLRGLGCMFLLPIPVRAQVVELVDTQVSEACT